MRGPLLDNGPQRMGNDAAGRRSLRVLFVSSTSEWIGATNSLLLLLKHLRHRYMTSVMLTGEGPFSEALRDLGVTVTYVDSLAKERIPAVARIVRRDGASLVHVNNTGGASRNALLAARIAGARCIAHCRSMPEQYSGWRLIPFNAANAVIAISQACADSLSRWIVADKIHVIHNGLDLGDYMGGRGVSNFEARRELGVNPEATLVMSVGHLMPRKAQHLAIQAVADCVTCGVGLHLALVGRLDRDPAYVESLRELTRELSIEDRVTFAGFRADVPRLLAASDVLIHTAIREAFGRAVIEGMASGLPVVALSTDGVREIVLHGETGYLVSHDAVSTLADLLRQLAADRDLRLRLGDRGRRHVMENFEASNTAESVAQLIEEVAWGSQDRMAKAARCDP